MNKINDKLMRLEEYLEMRNDSNAFVSFCDNFLPAVVGKAVWKNNVTSKLVSEMATPSDEAFVYLLLENNWNKWEEEARQAIAKLNKEEGVDELLEQDEEEESSQSGKSTIATEYTESNPRGGKNTGWSSEGMRRYNELYTRVTEDRAKLNNMQVKEEYRQYAQKTTLAENYKKRKEITIVTPRDDLDLLLGEQLSKVARVEAECLLETAKEQKRYAI